MKSYGVTIQQVKPPWAIYVCGFYQKKFGFFANTIFISLRGGYAKVFLLALV